MQENGDFVLENNSSEIVWSSGTNDYPHSTVSFGDYCNLVVKDDRGNIIWSSPNTCGTYCLLPKYAAARVLKFGIFVFLTVLLINCKWLDSNCDPKVSRRVHTERNMRRNMP